MILRPAPKTYSEGDQTALRDALRRADADNLKRGRDLEIGKARLILVSPGGLQFAVVVADDGSLSTTAL